MKKLFLIILCSTFVCLYSFKSPNTNSVPVQLDNSTLTLSGKFSGENIFIQNVIDNTNPKLYTVKSVFINGEESVKSYIFSPGFELNLRAMNFHTGDSVKIKIIHQANNPPIILNPEVLH
ncbi:MAG TPA: hypothetical protein VNX01_04945 [Bacteroidia bacterium]|jgi:hypothetical protein|nr:hypothetical protein [Bacteroidia bacterium]